MYGFCSFRFIAQRWQGRWGEPLPFLRHDTTGNSGVDVLSQDVKRIMSYSAPSYISFPAFTNYWSGPRTLTRVPLAFSPFTLAVRRAWSSLVALVSVRTLPARNVLTRSLSPRIPTGHLTSRTVAHSPARTIPRGISGESHAFTRSLSHSVPLDHLTP